MRRDLAGTERARSAAKPLTRDEARRIAVHDHSATIRPTPTWWSLVTAFSLIYREFPANYGRVF
jgi:hypothetical protein